MKLRTLTLLLPLFIATPLLAQKGWPDDPAEFQARREALMDRLDDGIFLAHSRWALKPWPEPGQRQDPTFYYLTGLERQIGGLLLLDSRRESAILFVSRGAGGMQDYGIRVVPGEESAGGLGFTDVLGYDEFVGV